MKFNSFKSALALFCSILLLSGCESLGTKEASATPDQTATPEAAATDANANANASESQTSGAPDEPTISAEELAAQKAKEAVAKEQAALREMRTFYFEFDQSSIQPDSRAALTAHAAFLTANPATKVVLEGYCDERGTKGYNIALGESRAKSIENFLMVNGVSKSQIEVISYGEENPASNGHTEADWAKNRRVYIEYK